MSEASEAHFHFTALQRTLFLHADVRGDTVKGLALGIGWHDPGTELFYLISDPRRPAPVWVPEASLTGQRWFDADTEEWNGHVERRRDERRRDHSEST